MKKAAAISQVFKNPEVLAALQGGLARMQGGSSGYIERCVIDAEAASATGCEKLPLGILLFLSDRTLLFF